MEGITIINTLPIYAATNNWMITVAISCIFAALVSSILAFFFSKLAYHTTSIVLVFVTMALVVITLVFCMIHALSDNINTDRIEKYQYEVLIEDSVRFNDFNDKYQVVDNRGEIYIIEKKN